MTTSVAKKDRSAAVAGLQQFATTPYGVAVAKYEEMSKFANKFASDPIVIAKAITRAVKAGRASARYVAPRSQNMIFLASTFLPRVMWDWAMRKVGNLNKKTINFDAVRATTPATSTDHTPLPVKKSPEARAQN